MSNQIVISGANGFIGRYLSEYFRYHGFDVVALIHHNKKYAIKGVDYRLFDLDSFSSDVIPANSLAFIHCAYIPFSQHNNSDLRNLKATQRLLNIARTKNVRKFVFLSSFSAHDKALSHYGKNKFEIEKIFDNKKDLILRPGLVKGDGGLYKKMESLIAKNSIIPLIGGGVQPVQLIDIEVLAKVIHQGVLNDISGDFNLANYPVITMKELYKSLNVNSNKKLFFLPINYSIAHLLIWLLGKISKNSPITNENLLGLKQMIVRETADLKLVFGLTD